MAMTGVAIRLALAGGILAAGIAGSLAIRRDAPQAYDVPAVATAEAVAAGTLPPLEVVETPAPATVPVSVTPLAQPVTVSAVSPSRPGRRPPVEAPHSESRSPEAAGEVHRLALMGVQTSGSERAYLLDLVTGEEVEAEEGEEFLGYELHAIDGETVELRKDGLAIILRLDRQPEEAEEPHQP